jgi:hypothetical protein
MFSISQRTWFGIAVFAAFGFGYLAASISWDAEAQTGSCRSAINSDVDNDVPPIVGMGNEPGDATTQILEGTQTGEGGSDSSQ